MAVSAFRSTTKRTQVGPSGNGKGRRASSFAEPGSKYFSDSSSMSDPRYGDSSRPRASSRRHSSLESESDADGGSKYSRRGARDGSESDGAASFRSLRRSSSQSDFSKHRSRKGGLISDQEVSGDEMQVEERTIRAVYAQMKQLRNKNPTEEFDVIGLYDAMKAEVRQAISDLRQEFRQQSGPERKEPVQLDDVEIRKEYAEQLEESERRANSLWSELAQEEQRCMNLAKMVKDLLPDSRSKVSKRAYKSRRYLNQRQMVSQSLDEDARKFFQECVTVSKLDCGGEDPSDAGELSERSSVISTEFTEAEAAKVAPLDQEAVASALPTQPERPQNTDKANKTTNREIDNQKQQEVQDHNLASSFDHTNNTSNRRAPVNADGVVMPWLEWETGSESSRKSREISKHSQASSFEQASSSGLFPSDGSSKQVEELRWDSFDAAGNDVSSSEVEELLHQRMRYIDRILSGRMHFCTDVF